MAKRMRIAGPLLVLILGVVLVVGVLASRSQETRVIEGAGPASATEKEAKDIDVRLTADGLKPASATVGRGQIVQWRNETRGPVRFVPADPGARRSQGLASGPVPAGETWAFRPVEPGRIAYRVNVETDAGEAGPRGVLEVSR